MKNIFYYLILLLLLAITTVNTQAQVGNWSGYTVTFDASSGKGDTEGNPIEISSAGQLAMLAQLVNNGSTFAGKFFKLTADIDLSGHQWTAIGVRANDNPQTQFRPFGGSFDGDGHIISNMVLHNNEYDNGLFSTIDVGAVVKKVGLVNSSLTGLNGVGAIVASNFGTLTDCYSSGNISGEHHVGILVGFNNPGAIINNCFVSGISKGNGNNVGGLVGFNDAGASITNCYSIGVVKGDMHVGGLVGVNNGQIMYSYAAGVVNGNDTVGGFVGSNGYIGENTTKENAAITSCYAAGNVTINRAGIIGGFVGSNKAPIAVASSYFDRQGTGQKKGLGYDGNSSNDRITGVNTAAFAVSTLPEGFDASVWQATAGYYPQLKAFASIDNAKAWSALSVVTLMLANNMERSDSVRTTFRLAEKTAVDENIGWSVSPAATAFIGNRWVSSINEMSWDTLTLAVGARSRFIVYRPEKKFSDANILAYEMGGKRYENPEEQTQIPVDCSYTAGQIAVKVITNPFATIVPGSTVNVDVSRPGAHTQGVTVTSVDGGIIMQYTLAVDRLLAANIFLQRWNDVLAVINNPANNGNYTFTAYEWYKNGNKLSTTTGYIQEPGGLDKSAAYTAVLTTSSGETLGTCPAVISDIQVKLAAYPNPVRRGQAVRVETNIPPEAGKAVIKVFDQMGNAIQSLVMQDAVTEVAMPYPAGQYILQVVAGSVSQTFKIIVE